MIIKYPYIIIGISLLVIPFLFIGAIFGSMIFLLSAIDADDLEFSYDYLTNSTQNILVVYPSYTYLANEPDSLVDYNDDCKECGIYNAKHSSYVFTKSNGLSDVGGSLYQIGKEYFTIVTDYTLEHTVNGTKILDMNDYDKVILMRNTYTTDNFRDMILNHDNVVYMFPDALTKKVATNSTYTKTSWETNIIMVYKEDIEPLHPMAHEWADDNRCSDWEFIKVQNGYMMNCTPDIAIMNNHEMIMAMRDIGTQPKVFKAINVTSDDYNESILINNATVENGVIWN